MTPIISELERISDLGIERPIKAKRSSSDGKIQDLQQLYDVLGPKNAETQSLMRRISTRTLTEGRIGKPASIKEPTTTEVASVSIGTINRQESPSSEVNDRNPLWTRMSNCFEECLQIQGRSGLGFNGYSDYSYLALRVT